MQPVLRIHDLQTATGKNRPPEIQVPIEQEANFLFKQDKVRRFVADLSSENSEKAQRTNEILAAERSTNRGHVFVDTREYTPVITPVLYKTSGSEHLKKVVTFRKVLPDGTIDYIKMDDGTALALDAELYAVSPVSSVYEPVAPNQRVRAYPVIGSNGVIEKTVEVLEALPIESEESDVISRNLEYIENNIQIIAWLYQSFHAIGKMESSVRRTNYEKVLKSSTQYKIPEDLVQFVIEVSEMDLPFEGKQGAGTTAAHAIKGIGLFTDGLIELSRTRERFLRLRIIGIKNGHPLRTNGTDNDIFLPQLEQELSVLQNHLKIKK